MSSSDRSTSMLLSATIMQALRIVHRRPVVLAGTLLLAVLATGGCAWRSATAEYYLGPVLFRYGPPVDDRPATSEVMVIGLLGEGGQQWGLSFGVVERTTIAPRYVDGMTARDPADAPRWSTPLSPLPPPVPGRWNLSLLYLRVDGLGPPALVTRRLHGLQLLAGQETNAASLGMVSSTRVDVPDNVVAFIDYDARSPMSARFSVWRTEVDEALPLTEILKEVIQ